MAENVDISLLAKVCRETLAETKAIRQDLSNVQMLAAKTVDVLTKMEDRNTARFNATSDRFAAIDKRFGSIDTHLAAMDRRFVAVDSHLRSIDLGIGGLKDELDLTIKSELMRALAGFEMKMVGLIEQRLAGKD